MRFDTLSGRGFSMLEILIAVTIISLSCLPVLYMASYNMETTRLDRVRLEAESICHNTLERFGHMQDNIAYFLRPSAANPQVLVGEDLYLHLADLYNSPGHLGLPYLVSQHKLKMKVEFRKNEAPGLHLLWCTVTWESDRDRFRKQEKVAYARYLLSEHYH